MSQIDSCLYAKVLTGQNVNMMATCKVNLREEKLVVLVVEVDNRLAHY